jgi:cell division protein ZapE
MRTPEIDTGVLQSIKAKAQHDGFELDSSQTAATQVLARAAAQWAAGGTHAVYLWGPVGRGKTWLLDAFLHSLPDVPTRRFHFHRFFRLFHEAHGRHRAGPSAVSQALTDLIGGASVLCFDELYAHETGDAQLFTVILTELRERRQLPMVVTSNYEPDGLLPDAEFRTTGATWEEPFVKVSHKMFEAGIALIKRTFEVVSIDGGTDYRDMPRPTASAGFRSGWYRIAAHTPSVDTTPVSIPVRGRTIRALCATDEAVVFDFRDLCDRPVGAGDVADLAERFGTWTIENVPKLADCTPEAAQRFVNFVDVLCDADVRLNITAACALRELLETDLAPPDIARLESRLRLLGQIEVSPGDCGANSP